MTKQLNLTEGIPGSVDVEPRFEGIPIPEDLTLNLENSQLNDLIHNLSIKRKDDITATIDFDVAYKGSESCVIEFGYRDDSKTPPVNHSVKRTIDVAVAQADIKMRPGKHPVPDWEDGKEITIECSCSNKTEPISILDDNLIIVSIDDRIEVTKKDENHVVVKMVPGKKPEQTGQVIKAKIGFKYFSDSIEEEVEINIPSVTTFEHPIPVPIKIWDKGGLPFKVITDGKDVTTEASDIIITGDDEHISHNTETGQWECVKTSTTGVTTKCKFNFKVGDKTHEHEITFAIAKHDAPLLVITQSPADLTILLNSTQKVTFSGKYCGKDIGDALSIIIKDSVFPTGVSLEPEANKSTGTFTVKDPLISNFTLKLGYKTNVSTTDGNTVEFKSDIMVTPKAPPIAFKPDNTAATKFKIGVWNTTPFTIRDANGNSLITAGNKVEITAEGVPFEVDMKNNKIRALIQDDRGGAKTALAIKFTYFKDGYHWSYNFNMSMTFDYIYRTSVGLKALNEATIAGKEDRIYFRVEGYDGPNDVPNVDSITSTGISKPGTSSFKLALKHDWRIEDQNNGMVSVGYSPGPDKGDNAGAYTIQGLTIKLKGKYPDVTIRPIACFVISEKDYYVAKVNSPRIKYGVTEEYTMKAYQYVPGSTKHKEINGILKSYGYGGLSGISQRTTDTSVASSWVFNLNYNDEYSYATLSCDFEGGEGSGIARSGVSIYLIKA